MKIVVIGGTGLIGSKLVTKLKASGYEVVAAAPNTGVNTLTGEGLTEVLKGAEVVVDVSNSPSFEDAAVMNFFQTSTRNLLSYEAAAGVGHHVALSIVGSASLLESGYMRAKVAQEKLIKEGSIPYSIIHSTQFFEFVKHITETSSSLTIICTCSTELTIKRRTLSDFTNSKRHLARRAQPNDERQIAIRPRCERSDRDPHRR